MGFAVDQSVQDEIGLATAGVYQHSIAWEQPYWVLMAYHPEIPQFISRSPSPAQMPAGEANDPTFAALRYSRYVLIPRAGEQYLHVYTFPQAPAYGHAVPLHIPDKASPGLTWIGDLLFAYGPEWVFAAGNNVELRHLGRDKYIVLPFLEDSGFGHDPEPSVRFGSTIYGLGPKDDLEFRFELRIDGRLTISTQWQAVPNVQFKMLGPTAENSIATVYVRNNGAGGSIYSSNVILQSTKPLLLPLR